MAWISTQEQLPDPQISVQTHVNEDGYIDFEQKAVYKNGKWYWPDGASPLPWVPTHWKEN